MDRENKIYQKEKLKNIPQDLKDITRSIYNYLDVLDLPTNQFETRISQIITTLTEALIKNYDILTKYILNSDKSQNTKRTLLNNILMILKSNSNFF